MKFESILSEAGGFGPFQIIMFFLLGISRMTLPWHFLLNNFIAATPPHHCNISSVDFGDVFGTLSQDQRMTVSLPKQDDGTFSNCHMFSEPQFHLLINSSNATGLPVVQCQSGWEYDSSTYKSTLASQFDLVCPKKGLTKAAATVFFVGVMFGAAVLGTLCDKYGRKPMLLVSYVSAIIFSVASAISTSFIMFAAFRFLTGFGLSGVSIISIVLTIEWVDIEHRTLVGVCGSIIWTIGNLLLAGIAFLITDWRLLTIAVTSPFVIAVLTWWMIPESARWLIVNGKTDQAYGLLQKCARVNGKSDFSTHIKPEILWTVTMAETHSRNYTYLDLIKTPRLRRISIYTGVVWYCVASTYYGISLNITGFGLNIYLTHFIYAAIELPVKLLMLSTLKRFGRRRNQVATLVLTGVCIVINIFTPREYWTFRTVIAVLGKGLSEGSFITVFLYTAELFPTAVRVHAFVAETDKSKGQPLYMRQKGTDWYKGHISITWTDSYRRLTSTEVVSPSVQWTGTEGISLSLRHGLCTRSQNGVGYTSFIGRLGASISPLVILLEDVWLQFPQVIFGMMAIGSSLVALLLPETNNVQLPETIEDIERISKESVRVSAQDQSDALLKKGDRRT